MRVVLIAAVVMMGVPGACLHAAEPAKSLGLFEENTDVGTVQPPGTAAFNPASGVYTLTAAGSNTWYHIDNFHYLWKKASGDLVLTAEVNFPPHTYNHDPDPHRKGILMFRQTLDAGGKYVGAAWHGSGLMALQFRRERGANSEDVELNTAAPRTVRIEKRGDTFTLFMSMKGEPLHPVGASVTLHLEEPFYIGLGAVSHNVNTTDRVEFSHVSLEAAPPESQLALYSTLQTISINDQFRRAMVVRSVPGYVQSPNWAPDGKHIYVHEGGSIQAIPYLDPPAGGPPQTIDTRTLVGCSGNFGLSPDGKLLAVSCAEHKGGQHDVYVLPVGSADAPRKVTNGSASSYFHAWGPDSRTIAFTRGRAAKADIFTIPVEGGTETRLTSDTLNDGPDFSPDGKFIYFDSSRSGTTQIWRMKPDGSDAEQVTDDEYINSSPHVAPDGKTVAFLSQVKSTLPAEPAPDGSDIGATWLRVIGNADGMIRNVASFQGSRGSFSMYGWGDPTHLAFISYRKLPAPDGGNGAPSKGNSKPSADATRARPAITGVSHIAVYATDPARTERFYVHDLGARKGPDPEDPHGVRYYFAPTQFVEVLPLPPGPPSINRLDHVGFTVADAEAARKYLASRKVAVPRRIEQGPDGSRWLDVLDPEGNRIELVQPPPSLPDVPVNPLSSHIIHVGFIVHDREREDSFYRTVLGFRPYWYGGMTDDKPSWISQQVPDGTDWLEYMLVGTPEDRGIPAGMSQATLGVLNHFSLGVADTRQVYTVLWTGNRLDGQSNTPKIGRDAKWQLNLIDPDGTRAEVMELHAIGTPCCSPFTAADPQR
jgi:Tol biopolymer transport system component/catechol 2,3-dioxygenase-like lactoylglutathione lyase family enzyme